jgi:RimJ/RimL family protein N-acetyltransferase
MFDLHPTELPQGLKSAFNLDQPAGLRCLGVLSGALRGRVLVDAPVNPTRALLHETTYGTIYLSGAWSSDSIAPIIHDLRQHGEVMIGLWPNDPRAALLPADTDYVGTVHDFYNHPPASELAPLTANLLANCELRPLDRTVFESLLEKDTLLETYGDVDTTLQTVLGYCLFYDGINVCEAVTGPLIAGVREIGIITRKDYRGRGYAKLTCAALLQECDRFGVQTFWNCNGSNLASLALARRLDYRRELTYTLYYWEPRPATS